MERRKFMQQTMLAGAGILGSGSLLAGNKTTALGNQNAGQTQNGTDKINGNEKPAAEKPFNLNYGFHQGMFEAHAGKNFIDQIKWAHDMGFRSIEDNGMMGRTVEEQKKIGDTLASLGMKMGVFVVTSDQWHWKTTLTTGKQEWIDKMVKDCKLAIEVAKRCNAKEVTVVPGNFDRSLSIEYQTANVIKALRIGSEILEPAGLIMVLEALSDDMYHMQRNEGDIMKNIERCWEEIGYFQIGDNPGRKEPTTGEMNYKNIFKYIHSRGWKGVMGMEHGNSKPGKEGELALIKAYRESDSFL
ncbi:MAG: xylose isomerase [Chitinophagaceae bacterium]|nr:MAG: xylose isomerase [Chitinophagaceae bacterium]